MCSVWNFRTYVVVNVLINFYESIQGYDDKIDDILMYFSIEIDHSFEFWFSRAVLNFYLKEMKNVSMC